MDSREVEILSISYKHLFNIYDFDMQIDVVMKTRGQ